ncbi:MAG: hypothetical protein IT207_06530 [Fimbriimonadaceae bacterium]|nr:hypothetical protein [Fimbriimonadaceae bacterium]
MKLLLSLAVAALTLPALAQDTFTLKRVVAAGESTKYKLQVDTTFGGMAVVFTAALQESIVSVAADGTVVSKTTQSNVVLKVNGSEMDAGAEDETDTTTTDARGRIVLIEGSMVDEASYRVAILNAILWPETPVMVGSKWSLDLAASEKQGTPASKSEFEILGMEAMKGVEAVKIRFSTHEATGETPASSTGTYWVEKATGKILRTEAEWKNAPVSGQIIDAKVVIELAS